MKKSREKYYKEKLKLQEEKLLQEIGDQEQKGKESQKERNKELSSYDNHPADQATDTFDRERETGFLDNDRVLLIKIRAALKLIEEEDKTYGQCQECGLDIDRERLNVVPHTLFCRDCAHQKEKPETKERPVEGEVITQFGDTSGEDNVAFDGEDTWSKVVQDGTSTSLGDNNENLD